MSAPTKPRKRPAKKAASPRKTAAATETTAMADAFKPSPVPIYTEDKVTPAGAWNQGTVQGFVIELPSGNFAKLRRTLSLPTLLANGKIPNPLADMVRQMISQGKVSISSEEMSENAMMQFAQLVNEQIPMIFVDPRVEAQPPGWDIDKQGIWTPSPGAMDINMLTFEDQMYAFQWAQGAATDVATFRQRANENMASVQHGEGVEQTTG